jgi:hypothetical protein
MSGERYWNPVTRSDKSDRWTSSLRERVDWTYPVQELGTSDNPYWNPTREPDKPGWLEELGRPGHVRQTPLEPGL